MPDDLAARSDGNRYSGVSLRLTHDTPKWDRWQGIQVLRRAFNLAGEWAASEKALPKVRILPGERHREFVVPPEAEAALLEAAAPLLRDTIILLRELGLRPEECFRLRWTDVQDGRLWVQHGKTAEARRCIPAKELSPRAWAVLAMRRGLSDSEWVFPAPTKSGHIEPSSLKKQAAAAFRAARVQPFELCCWRHTGLKGWAAWMDPWTHILPGTGT